MAFSKGITNLERAGDEARKIAKRTRKISNDPAGRNLDIAEIRTSGQMAGTIFHDALAAFARLDTVEAARIMRDDEAIDEQYRAFVRRLPAYMAGNPRVISSALDYVSIASAIERIGDHAKNLAELVIYVVKGKDVRHLSRDRLEREALDD
ncbi:phosphate transport system regulatory protein PhoU [Paraburkholderia unamae]|nr:phosphate transport system regulatory protein PhoU [Paraburkholderia unamae]